MPPVGVEALKKRVRQLSLATVAKAAMSEPRVSRFASAVVWVLLSGSNSTLPHPPVDRSTKFGTFPAAIRSPSGFPEMDCPLMNLAAVKAEATVVSSLTTTFSGGFSPSTVNRTIAGLSPRPLLTVAFAAFGNQIEDDVLAGGLCGAELKPTVSCQFLFEPVAWVRPHSRPTVSLWILREDRRPLQLAPRSEQPPQPGRTHSRAVQLVNSIMAICALSILSIALSVRGNRKQHSSLVQAAAFWEKPGLFQRYRPSIGSAIGQ